VDDLDLADRGFPGLRLRRADDADAPELRVLQLACWVAEALDNDRLDIPALHETLDDVRHGIAVQQTWVVREGPRLVGSVRGKVHGDAWEIGRLMVAPDLAGRGLGRSLLTWIEQQLPDEVGLWELFTGARSARNLRIYTGAGYVLEGESDGVAHLSKPRESSAPAVG
jgi:GNAT superfamily N-acetyltransferase